MDCASARVGLGGGEEPVNSAQLGATPYAQGGARHKGGRAVTSPPHVGQSPPFGDAEISHRGTGARGRGRSACVTPWGADTPGQGQYSTAGHGSHTMRGRGDSSGQRSEAE